MGIYGIKVMIWFTVTEYSMIITLQSIGQRIGTKLLFDIKVRRLHALGQ